MSILSTTPKSVGVPRPPSPMNPVACESSTMTLALYFSARAAILSSGATSPSMEKTPSVTMSRMRFCWVF
ncbi:hypothetical protein DQ04_19521010 [Trypanosoma grayi]|uniref:hypothetical protein n=1 Tax=Trypanosoma grayi TaxID=71804 RepID=UPI0004F4AA4D|nr:hypothetical protein DQ04_19521010 [Trypanosoma grayi]KEG05666.1 hypothetical protein DQ04_19521010 [Trypanosoma grayi]